MIGTNPAWDAKTAALAKTPVYALTLSGEPVVYTTHHLASLGITGALPPYEPWLKTPQGATQTIDVLKGSSSVGEMQCEVIDKGGAVRQLVGSTTLEGRTATLSVGYPGIDYSQFVALHTYQLFKITPSRGYTSWLFRARDRQMTAKRTVYKNPLNDLPLEESNPWIVQGTPAEITQAIYLFALNRPLEEIDRAAMELLDSPAEGLFHASRPFQFMLNRPFEAKQFLESEVYRPSGLYPVIDNLGRISLRAARPPASGPQAVFKFTDANVIVLPEIDRMPIMNEIIFKIDHDGDDFRNELIFVDGGSLSTYGRSGQHVIESHGLRTVCGAQWFCQEASSRLFRRFAGTPASLRGGAPVLRVEAFFLSLPVWVGDYVTVTHPKMPNILTGDLGVADRLYEVIDREPDYARGRMRYRLLDTGVTAGGARQFAPSAAEFVIGVSPVY
jgi:hypothetical protein